MGRGAGMNEHFELIAETGFLGLELTQPKQEEEEHKQESDDGEL